MPIEFADTAVMPRRAPAISQPVVMPRLLADGPARNFLFGTVEDGNAPQPGPQVPETNESIAASTQTSPAGGIPQVAVRPETTKVRQRVLSVATTQTQHFFGEAPKVTDTAGLAEPIAEPPEVPVKDDPSSSKGRTGNQPMAPPGLSQNPPQSIPQSAVPYHQQYYHHHQSSPMAPYGSYYPYGPGMPMGFGPVPVGANHHYNSASRFGDEPAGGALTSDGQQQSKSATPQGWPSRGPRGYGAPSQGSSDFAHYSQPEHLTRRETKQQFDDAYNFGAQKGAAGWAADGQYGGYSRGASQPTYKNYPPSYQQGQQGQYNSRAQYQYDSFSGYQQAGFQPSSQPPGLTGVNGGGQVYNNLSHYQQQPFYGGGYNYGSHYPQR